MRRKAGCASLSRPTGSFGEAGKVMYVAGFKGGLVSAGLGMVFNPKIIMAIDSGTSGWTYEQLVAVVDKYIKDNPHKWDRDLKDLTFEALVDACEKRGELKR